MIDETDLSAAAPPGSVTLPAGEAPETLDRAGLVKLLETLMLAAFRSEIGGVSDALKALEHAKPAVPDARSRERLSESLARSRKFFDSLDFSAIAAETKALLRDVCRPS